MVSDFVKVFRKNARIKDIGEVSCRSIVEKFDVEGLWVFSFVKPGLWCRVSNGLVTRLFTL